MASETNKSRPRRLREGFFDKYIRGHGIDIGCGRSYGYADDLRVHETALAHDLDICDAHGMSKYGDGSFDYVHSSHVLEHMRDPVLAIRNWYRICREGGFLIITVPSQYRYEKRVNLPSQWNADHKKFYTMSGLFLDIELALEPNTYLVEYAKDCVDGYDWSIGPTSHSVGEYQIECVLKKIEKPSWVLY